MPRTLIATLLLSIVMIGTIDAAGSAPAAGATRPSAARMSPLPPGGAAGVRQAQGADWSGPLIGAAVTGGIFLALLLLVDTDDEGPVTSTTSSQ